MQILRDLPPFTSIVQSTVGNWTFNPATSGGYPITSALPVSFVFCPYNPNHTQLIPLSASALPPSSPIGDAQYVPPPQIASASYPVYPANTVANGTVVLDVTIGKSGQVTKVRAVRSVADLTQPAINAVKSWSYNRATVDGNSAVSKMVLVFVFQRNLS